MKKKQNWNYICDGANYTVLIYSCQKRCFFYAKKNANISIFSLSDIKKWWYEWKLAFVLLEKGINLFFKRSMNKNKIDWIKCEEGTHKNFK